jgi:DNA-binding transcriptional regulator YiaG
MYLTLTAEQIQSLRKSTGLSLMDFGQLFGVSHATVISWENGTTKPDAFKQAALSQLDRQVKTRLKKKPNEDIGNILKGVLITAGIVGFIMLLANMDDR